MLILAPTFTSDTMSLKYLSTALASLLLLQQSAEAELLRTYFGTSRSAGIYTGVFDTDSGELSPITLAAETNAPGFLAIHPNHRFLYATNAAFQQPTPGGVAAFRIQPNGGLSLVNQQPTSGRGTCHLNLDPGGQVLLAANYTSGTVNAFKILTDGSISPAVTTHQHQGAGAHPKRQKAPHPHSVLIHPYYHYAYVPDLGMDQVVIYSLEQDRGALKRAGEANVPGGSQGPRHMKFSLDGKHAYVLNELSLSLASYSVSGSNGQLEYIDSISVFSADNQQATGSMTCAEIRVHPNGQWIYTSTRDLEDQGRDTLSTFKRAPDGSLSLISNTPAGVDFPRNFNIDPTGQWLIAAGQRSSTLAIFSIDPHSGMLILHQSDIPFQGQPICVEFLGQ